MLDPTTHPLAIQREDLSNRSIQHPASGIQHPVSSIQHDATDGRPDELLLYPRPP
jgi:hypothetical protein